MQTAKIKSIAAYTREKLEDQYLKNGDGEEKEVGKSYSQCHDVISRTWLRDSKQKHEPSIEGGSW